MHLLGPASKKHSPAASLEVPKPEPAVPATPEVSLPPQKTEEEETEVDLDTMEGVVAFIVAHWKKGEQESVLPVTKFWVQNKLLPQCRKDKPLSHVYLLESKHNELFTSKAGRKAWFVSWQKNRSQRFVKLPKAS